MPPCTASLKWVVLPSYFAGYGEEKGGITSLLHNHHPTDPLPVVYFATFPWFLRIFLHTLTIRSEGKDIKPGMTSILELLFLPITQEKATVKSPRLQVQSILSEWTPL